MERNFRHSVPVTNVEDGLELVMLDRIIVDLE